MCSSALAYSTAGEIDYDTNGNPIPVGGTGVSSSSQEFTPTPTPAEIPDSVKSLPKRIVVDLSEQTLSYYYGDYLVNTIKISSGIAQLPTPTGTFHVLDKIPVKEYIGRNLNGTMYDLPNTKWNLKFSDLGYYIHGAYWHHNFGHPMSHGCVNVSYQDMPELYDFADVGTVITIHK